MSVQSTNLFFKTEDDLGCGVCMGLIVTPVVVDGSNPGLLGHGDEG